MDKFQAACVQLCCGQDMDANIEAAGALIREAAADGAVYILTPEQTSLMELKSKPLFAQIVEEGQDRGVRYFRTLAKELKIWLHIGSVALRLNNEQAANRSILINPQGEIVARYDKIHMFDVNLPNGEVYRESKNYRSGDKAVIADLPWGRVGLSICYDLRFPALYRALAQGGACFLTIPAAFTRQTGKAHWHVLQRARAIETGSFVFAAAQGGTHKNGRETFGHSMIVSPWGEIIAEAGTDPCVIHAEIDPVASVEARQRIPALTHDRDFTLVEGPAASVRAAE